MRFLRTTALLAVAFPLLAQEGPPDGPPDFQPPPLPESAREQLPPKLPDNLPQPSELREQLLLLDRFLQLPPEQLVHIRQTIARIEAMPAEERAALRERLRAITELPSQAREALAERAPTILAGDLKRLRAYWLGMSEEMRAEEDAHLAGLDVDEQERYFRRLALKLRAPSVAGED